MVHANGEFPRLHAAEGRSTFQRGEGPWPLRWWEGSERPRMGPPLPAVALSALVVEIVARGGGSGLSQAMKTRSGVPSRPQAPHLGSPRTQETVLGPEGSSLGSRPHKHSPQRPEKEEVQILEWP